jgi:hypothetical protein
MIEKVELDGIEYPITIEKEKVGENIVGKFKVVLGGKEQSLKVEYTSQLVEDLKTIQGIDAEEELKNILIYELKSEIYQFIHGTTVREQLDKVIDLAGKEDSELDALISSDIKFASFIRNFHPNQYQELTNE